MTETLPVGWSSIPGVLYLHVIPRFEGRGHRDVGGGERGGEEGKHREPTVSHEQ